MVWAWNGNMGRCWEIFGIWHHHRTTMGQGIRTGGGTVIPIASGIGMMAGTGGDRRNTGSLRAPSPAFLFAWEDGSGATHSAHGTERFTFTVREPFRFPSATVGNAVEPALPGSLTKAFRMSTNYKPRGSNGGGSGAGSDKNSVYSSTSPTPSFSSSEGGIYATVGGSLQSHPAFFHHHHLPPPTSAPPPIPGGTGARSIDPSMAPAATGPDRANNRVSAPPMDSGHATLPKYAQHRRVKSISDIEIPSVGPVG
uniref:Uncharacterized protein n=1 Tax=Anopheles farauti TaxID=69004 RepID=A0A182QXI5_9DIPT